MLARHKGVGEHKARYRYFLASSEGKRWAPSPTPALDNTLMIPPPPTSSASSTLHAGLGPLSPSLPSSSPHTQKSLHTVSPSLVSTTHHARAQLSVGCTSSERRRQMEEEEKGPLWLLHHQRVRLPLQGERLLLLPSSILASSSSFLPSPPPLRAQDTRLGRFLSVCGVGAPLVFSLVHLGGRPPFERRLTVCSLPSPFPPPACE